MLLAWGDGASPHFCIAVQNSSHDKEPEWLVSNCLKTFAKLISKPNNIVWHKFSIFAVIQLLVQLYMHLIKIYVLM
jgi:hypothetical protein